MATKKPAKRAVKKAPAKSYRVRKQAKRAPVTDAQMEQAFMDLPYTGQDEVLTKPQRKLACWSPLWATVDPGLYLLQGHEGNFVPARLVLTDNGVEKNLTFYALSSGEEAKSHCIKSVYGPIEEPSL